MGDDSLKKETPTQAFSCEYCEFLRTAFLWNTCGGCFGKTLLFILTLGKSKPSVSLTSNQLARPESGPRSSSLKPKL